MANSETLGTAQMKSSATTGQKRNFGGLLSLYTPYKQKYDWSPFISIVDDYTKNGSKPTVDIGRLLLQGGAHSNTNFNPVGSDRLYVTLGGAGEGENGIGSSYYDYNLPNQIRLRFNDTPWLRKILDEASRQHIPTVVAGHSMGGEALFKPAKDYPGVFFIADDPVGPHDYARYLFRTGDTTAPTLPNLLYHMPTNAPVFLGSKNTFNLSNLISIIGGRRFPKREDTIFYSEPYHFTEVADALDNNYMLWAAKMLASGKSPEYVKKTMVSFKPHKLRPKSYDYITTQEGRSKLQDARRTQELTRQSALFDEDKLYPNGMSGIYRMNPDTPEF